jgi:hypothetical protein
LVEVGLSNDNRPGAFEPLDDERRTLGAIAESGTGRRCREAGDIDIVLHDERHAEEWLVLAPRRSHALRNRQSLRF